MINNEKRNEQIGGMMQACPVNSSFIFDYMIMIIHNEPAMLCF